MATHDYVIANQGFPAFRSDLNSVLAAVISSNSGTSRPSSAVAGTIWYNTSSSIIYLYNGSTDVSLLPVALSWITKTGTYTAINGDRIFVDTSGGAVTITLPASPTVGDQVNFVDSRYTFDTNALTVGRNSSKIANATADLVVNTEGAAFGLVYSGSNVGWTYTEK
jgi:hypothetical protein|tara:strand:+ start:789 stop:1286 length:498 start_codon:yes stop_codon:yes gene_type:complete